MEPAKDHIRRILLVLTRQDPNPETCLRFETPWQLLVATILSAQCTDERVNLVTPALFRKYPDVAAFAGADRAVLEADIRPTGFFRNKAKSIQGAARMIVEEFDGRVPESMVELVTLPGVARKTGNIVLSSAFGKAEGIAVDVHVARLSGRLGLSREIVPERIERDLLALVPKAYWLRFNHLLVNYGRAVCKARKPLCGECRLASLCPKIGVVPLSPSAARVARR
jgi:endonuclease-3